MLKLEAKNKRLLSMYEENVQKYENQNKIIQEHTKKIQDESNDFNEIVRNLEIRVRDKKMFIQMSKEKNGQNLENQIKEMNILVKKNNDQFEYELNKKQKFINIYENTIENLMFQKSKIENILNKYNNRTEQKNKIFENEIEMQQKKILKRDQMIKNFELKIQKIEKNISNYLIEIQNLKEENHELTKVNELYENASHFRSLPNANIFPYEKKILDLEKEIKIKDRMMQEQNIQIEAMKKNEKGGNYADCFQKQISTANELHALKENYSQAQTQIGELQQKLEIYQIKNMKYLTKTGALDFEPKSNQSFNMHDEVNIELQLQRYKLENKNLQLENSKYKVKFIENKNYKLKIKKLENENIALKKEKYEKRQNLIKNYILYSDPKLRKKNFEQKIKKKLLKSMGEKIKKMEDYTQRMNE